MNVGIFGGSFNPVHVGHVALAKAMLEYCGLDEVWLMVSPQNPLKQQADLLDDQLRFEMAQLAVQDVEGVVACDYEFQLPKPSYTWHTLQQLSQDYPDTTFTLLIGGDNWQRFERWYHWKDILRNYKVVVYPRPPSNSPAPSWPPPIGEELGGEQDSSPKQGRMGRVWPGWAFPLIDVSSTDIRYRIRHGDSISGLVPETVEQFIKERGLYR